MSHLAATKPNGMRRGERGHCHGWLACWKQGRLWVRTAPVQTRVPLTPSPPPELHPTFRGEQRDHGAAWPHRRGCKHPLCQLVLQGRFDYLLVCPGAELSPNGSMFRLRSASLFKRDCEGRWLQCNKWAWANRTTTGTNPWTDQHYPGLLSRWPLNYVVIQPANEGSLSLLTRQTAFKEKINLCLL